MDRFPMLTTYRGILQLVAVIVILVGFLGSIGLAQSLADEEYNRETGKVEKGFSFTGFLVGVVFFGGIALSLLITAEFIQLALTIESHLYKMQSEIADKAPSPPKSRLMDRLGEL